MKITKTGYIDGQFITFSTEDASATKIKELLQGLQDDQHLTMTNDSGVELAMARFSINDFRMDLTEISVGGVQSRSTVDQSELSFDLINDCFVMFSLGEVKALPILVNWQPIEIPVVETPSEIIASREKFLAKAYEDIALESKRMEAEVDAEMERFLKIVGPEIESLAAHKEQTIKQDLSIYTPTFWNITNYGSHNKKIICPHCAQVGFVHTKKVSKKAGISGGKASAAILTAGFSLLALGLSRSEKVIESYCANCESIW